VNDLPVFLEHVPLHQQQQMWFMHEGAPLRCLRRVRQQLNQTFGAQWTGRGGSVNWPSWSPDLSPFDFGLWKYVKTSVYSALIYDLEALQQRAENACREIRVKPEIFDRVRISVWRRAVVRVVLKCKGTTNSVCCKDLTNIAHISAGICFWIYVDWEFFCLFQWVLYPITACNTCFNTL
jgi:hypothetical protein